MYKTGDQFEYKGKRYLFGKYVKIKINGEWIQGVLYTANYLTIDGGHYVRTIKDFNLKFKPIG